jgi:hypothetical protein
LQASGVLLFTCSRNDEPPVLAAWPPAHLCPVQPGHAVAHAFGWDAKSDRLSRLAHAIGLAHDAILFLDDTAAERAEVRQALPCVRVLGEDMATAADVLAWEADRCASAGVSADAASRTESECPVFALAACVCVLTRVRYPFGLSQRRVHSWPAPPPPKPSQTMTRLTTSLTASVLALAAIRRGGARRAPWAPGCACLAPAAATPRSAAFP